MMIGKQDLRGTMIEHSIAASKSFSKPFGHIRQNFAALLQIGWHVVSPAAVHKIKRVSYGSSSGEGSRNLFTPSPINPRDLPVGAISV